MFLNVLALILMAAVVLFFGWLTRRAWGTKNVFLKWFGAILSGWLTLVIGLVSILGWVGFVKYATPKIRPVQEIQVEGTPEQIARGEHLAAAFCVECHSTTADFPMTGGVDMGNDLPMNLGNFYSGNLTPAGRLKDWSDGEIFRALRDNVDKDGNRLLFMAGTNVRYLSDEDIYAVVAFLRSLEPVEHEIHDPLDQPTVLAFIMFGANLIPERPMVEGVIEGPEKAPTAEYGKFMMTFLDCTICHGTDLAGGTSNITPNGPSLRSVKGWTQDEFITALRTGVNPNGDELSILMPWRSTGRLDDVELGALYQYLISLEGVSD